MELRQLIYLQSVARTGGFTRAAEELHIAQPAISAQIRRLEHELGVQLLQRNTRSVEVTHAGSRFLAHVAAALAHLDEAKAEAEAHRGVERGHVRVGTTPLTGGLDLIGALSRFRTRYPGVTLSLRTGFVDPLLEGLRKGELDVVVAPSHGAHEPGFRSVPVALDRLVLITPPSDVRSVCELADVAEDRFVCLPQASGLRRMLDAALAPLGVSPRVEFETHSPASIRELVAAGLGSAVIAESAIRCPGPAVTVHEVPGLPEHPPICVFSASGSGSAAAGRFVADLLDGVRPVEERDASPVTATRSRTAARRRPSTPDR